MSATTTVQTVTLTRDRPTWLIYLQLAAFATYLYGLSAALPLLRAELGLSQTIAGLHGTAIAVGGIISGITLPALTARFGRRTMVWAGLAGMNVGVLAVAVAHALPVTLTAYTVASTCSAMTLYAGMATLSDHHGPGAGPAAISEANAVAVIAGVAMSYAFSLSAGSAIGWRFAMAIPLVGTAVLAVTMGSVWVPNREPHPTRHEATGHKPTEHSTIEHSATQHTAAPDVPRVAYGWRFHVAGAVMLCCVALEFTFNLWAAELLSQRTGLTAAMAATGLTAMLVGVALGRLGGARLALRFRPPSVLLGSLGVTMAGWALFWTSSTVPLAYAGLALSGLGLSVLFPFSLTTIIAASGGRPDQASGVASIWGGVGAGAGPLILGALGDGFGTHTAFLLAPLLIGLAMAGIVSARPRS